MFCQPENALKLFEDFWGDWTDDFKYKGQRRGVIFTEDQLKTMVRLDLQVRLQTHELDLQHFGLPPMTEEERISVAGLVNTEDTIIREELEYDVRDLRENTNLAKSKFTVEQKNIFDVVMSAVQKKRRPTSIYFSKGRMWQDFSPKCSP